jgi:tripartite-type tricarboxylate transporter receptor subunit TctC
MASKSCSLFLATVIGLSMCMPIQSVLAQEPFYKGKSLRFLVNFPAGGATDVVARLVARYLPKHIAGNPTVVVQNMAGGGGNIGINYVYEIAKPDGLTVGVFSGGYLPQILGSSGVRFDLNTMPIIAGVGETSIVYIKADTGVKAASDILKPLKPIVIGGFTRESNKDLALRMALDLLGVPYRYVTGYGGEADLRLAIQRGEINYTSEGLTGYTMGGAQLAREGIVVPLYQDGLGGPKGDIVRDPRADLPTFREFFRTVKKAEPSGPLGEAFKISGAVRSMGRYVVAPPKTPGTVVEILRKGFRDTFEDPEFKAESERVLRFQLVSFVGDDAEKVNAAVFRSATVPVRDALKKMTQE